MAEEGFNKAKQFKQYCVQYGSVSVREMLNLNKHNWPKHKESIPAGKLNHQNRLVTGPEEIKLLFSNDYSDRLRPRPTNPDFKGIEKIKHEVFEIKLNEAKQNKSSHGNMQDTDKVLGEINQN